MQRFRPHFPRDWSFFSITPSNLNLDNTLPVGQTFLWHRRPLADGTNEYSRAISDPPRVVCLRQSSLSIFFTAIHPSPEDSELDRSNGHTKRWLEDYFQLTRYPNLDELYAEWRLRDPELFGKLELNERAQGVRVLRQDPWECLVAFITSTNNHIPRISSLLHRLSVNFSNPLFSLCDPYDGEETVYYLFPRPQDLPDSGLEVQLRDLGFGYRAPFLESTLKTLRACGDVEQELERWRTYSMAEARVQLLNLKGVGRKVADCVLLMCMDQPSLIPVDTHVGAIAARHPAFPSRLRNKPMSKALYDEIQQFLSQKWGPLGGWCQAVLFAADLTARTPVKTRTIQHTIKREVPASPTAKKRQKVEEDSPILKRTRSTTLSSRISEGSAIVTRE